MTANSKLFLAIGIIVSMTLLGGTALIFQVNEQALLLVAVPIITSLATALGYVTNGLPRAADVTADKAIDKIPPRTGEARLSAAGGEAGTKRTVPLIVEWSRTGEDGSWHQPFKPGDMFMRNSTDAGFTWTDPIKVVGEDRPPAFSRTIEIDTSRAARGGGAAGTEILE